MYVVVLKFSLYDTPYIAKKKKIKNFCIRTKEFLPRYNNFTRYIEVKIPNTEVFFLFQVMLIEYLVV